MSQTSGARSRRADDRAAALPAALGAFDPVGEIRVSDSRAAARAARAEEFAARFGLDEPGPDAAAIADRYGFRYEPWVGALGR
jgi:hypothetical protein